MYILVLFIALISSNFALPQQRHTKLGGRIIGGEDADISEYPYQAQVLLTYGSYICAGVILNEDSILTPAQCTNRLVPEELLVRVGTSDRDLFGEIYFVSAIHQHPNFDFLTLDYDVSVLKLEPKINFGDNIQPIDLHTENPEDGSESVITGWGALYEGGFNSNQLQAVDVSIVNHDECSETYYGGVTERMICAIKPGKGFCHGDSGSALVTDGKLAGIGSYGVGCGRPDYPGVFTSVANLHSFITEYL